MKYKIITLKYIDSLDSIFEKDEYVIMAEDVNNAIKIYLGTKTVVYGITKLNNYIEAILHTKNNRLVLKVTPIIEDTEPIWDYYVIKQFNFDNLGVFIPIYNRGMARARMFINR